MIIKRSSDISGEINPLIAMIAGLGLAVLALGISTIYYVGKTNTATTNLEAQKAQAVEVAKAEQKKTDEEAFAQTLKEPYRTYLAPVILGAIRVDFPKNWNIYAVEDDKSALQLDIFMHPEIVRSEKTSSEPYAFRLQLARKQYPESISAYQKLVEKGELRAQSVTVSNIGGVRFEGQIEDGVNGHLIALPVRDKTLLIWTESASFVADFNNVIAKLSVSP